MSIALYSQNKQNISEKSAVFLSHNKTYSHSPPPPCLRLQTMNFFFFKLSSSLAILSQQPLHLGNNVT